MEISVAQQIHDAAQALFTSGTPLAEALTSTLNQFLTWPFSASAACVTDTEGKTTGPFPLVLYTSSQEAPPEPVHVKADTVACVFHIVDTLTPEDLCSAYKQIGALKRLKRIPLPQTDYARNDAPIGIVFSVDASEPLEKLAEQMMLLNKTHPSREWPDMVVVLTRGTINYACQFEGDPIAGDFFLPNLTDFPVTPLYAHVLGRSLGLFSLNKMCAFVFAQLQVFSPGTMLPDIQKVMEGVSLLGLTFGAYQFNLKGQLVPVPDEMYADRGRGLLELPLRIEDKKGKLLSHFRFIPWQDGGVIRVIGNIPLEGLLMYLGPVAKKAQIIKKPDGAISSVLPIGRREFMEMVGQFQRQTNMFVKPEQPKWTILKFADEGTNSPFVARLSLGPLKLRDVAQLQRTTYEAFDNAFAFVSTALMNTRTTARTIAEMMAEHSHRIAAGEIARLQGHVIHIDKPIDRALQKEVDDFLNNAVRAIKHGMQNLMNVLQINIGFLFKKDNAFEHGVADLAKKHPELAAYLRETRKWSERLVLSRNNIEHDGWMLPRVEYIENAGQIDVKEPHISGQPVTEFVRYILDRLCCFIEEMTVYALQAQMPENFSVTEIPLAQRKPECPERFQPALALGGMPLWAIAYHESTFEKT
jgi:hypothetical protein